MLKVNKTKQRNFKTMQGIESSTKIDYCETRNIIRKNYGKRNTVPFVKKNIARTAFVNIQGL